MFVEYDNKTFFLFFPPLYFIGFCLVLHVINVPMFTYQIIISKSESHPILYVNVFPGDGASASDAVRHIYIQSIFRAVFIHFIIFEGSIEKVNNQCEIVMVGTVFSQFSLY